MRRRRINGISLRRLPTLLLTLKLLVSMSLTLLTLLSLPGATSASAAAATAASRCRLNRTAAPSPQVEVLVTFAAGGGAPGDPEPGQARRFVADRDYIITARSLNPRTGIVRFAVGLLPYRGGGGGGGGDGGNDVGRFLQLPGQELGERDNGCSAFFCYLSCPPRPAIAYKWAAPSVDGAACVEVRALVTLEYDDSNWLRTSAFLCRVSKEGRREEDDVRLLPAAPCCACGSANYLLRFEGTWSPKSEKVTAAAAGLQQRQAWSVLLGTTHDDTYAPWEFGGYASAGVQNLCRSGVASVLENEIKYFGLSSVLTVIKARDLPLSGGQSQRDQSRSAIFTVNSTHHLLTFLSRPVPESGSCVGLSMLDLCQANCTWAEEVTAELRLWAGDYTQRIAHVAGANLTLATVVMRRIPPRQEFGAAGTTGCPGQR